MTAANIENENEVARADAGTAGALTAEKATHTFKKGNRVNILNSTLSGRIFCEGRAEIVRPIRDVDEQYVVRFFEAEGPGASRLNRDRYERFVDPAAQVGDGTAYVDALNAKAEGR